MKSIYIVHYYFFFLILLILSACEKNDVIAPAIEDISDIEVQDNGNKGNGLDIEVNFRKQFSTTDIQEYRIFAIKAEKSSDFTIEQANAISADHYTIVGVNEIYPIKGKTLQAESTDTDGDIISEKTIYIFAVMTVSKDQEEASNSLVLDDQPFQLKNNSQIYDYTRELEVGSGSLVLDNEGSIFMADYNIQSHLQNNSGETFSIYEVSKSGVANSVSPSYKLLSGNAFDNAGNLYQSILFSSEIIKMGSDGETNVLLIDGDQPLSPDGIYVDRNNILFVVNQKTKNILKITPDGNSTVFARVGGNPRGITGDKNGNLYVSHNHESGEITKVTPEGEVSVLANIPTFKPINYTLGYLMWVGYIVYQEGNLYVAGLSTNQIYKIGLDGEIEVFAGSGRRGIPRGGILTANLNRPMGLVFSDDGKSLFISGCTDITPQHTQYSTPGKIWEIKLVE